MPVKPETVHQLPEASEEGWSLPADRQVRLHRHQEVDKQYQFFTSDRQRQELFAYTQRVVEYMRTENIRHIILFDRAARPMYVGMLEYMHQRYPEEPSPDIFFLNPTGFHSKESAAACPSDVQRDIEFSMDVELDAKDVRSQQDIDQEFRTMYSRLMDVKDEPLLIFDTCIHSGARLEQVKASLERLGFSQLIIGSVTPADAEAKVQSDFFVTAERPEKECLPFDQDGLMQKRFDHVYSEMNTKREAREESIALRYEIRDVMRERLSQATRTDRMGAEHETH